MAKLPDPSSTNRKTPTPGGPSGYLQPTHIGTPGADTAIGDALMGIGDEAYKFAMAEKARMDDVAVDDAKNQYLQQALDIENEYSQIKGKAAVDQDIVKDYSTKLDTVSEKISSGFKNDAQRRAWDSYFKNARVRFTAGVMKHKLNESDQYASETYKSTNYTRTQVAHSNWADAGVVNNSASDIVKNIAKEKLRSGWGDERTEAELKSALGPLWSGVAAQYINAKQYKMAKKILDQHQDVIGVDKYTSYHKSIEASETIDLSQSKSDEIMATIKGSKNQIQAARDIKDPEIRDATLTRVKARINDNQTLIDQAKKEENESITNKALDLYRNGGTKTQFLDLVDQTRDKATRKELIALANAYYPESGQGTKQTDWNKSVAAYKEIDQSIKDQNPISEAELIRKYRPYMTAGDFEETLKYLKAGGNVNGMSKPEADRWFKYFTDRKSEERPEAFSSYWDYLKTRLEPGKKPSTDDYKKWSDEWMNTEGMEKDILFDDEMTRGTAIKKGELDSWTENKPEKSIIAKPMPPDPRELKDPLGIR